MKLPAQYLTPAERRRWVVETFGTESTGFTPEVLQKLADGPIMDPNTLYLPAGRLSEAEWARREATIKLRGS